MTRDELETVLKSHKTWLSDSSNGARANLSSADLSYADLSGADLRNANLRNANLRYADLRYTDLRGANLRGAYLSYAGLRGSNLRDAGLRGSDLRGTDLREANLRNADLRGTYLRGAHLISADLSEARLPHFSLVIDGDMIVWKKLRSGVIAKLLVPAEARRTSSLVDRKCRAEYVRVLELFGLTRAVEALSLLETDGGTIYKVGEIVRADSYDDDIRVSCTHGIHFFITRQEAEE
jgi:hypothetical protein